MLTEIFHPVSFIAGYQQFLAGGGTGIVLCLAVVLCGLMLFQRFRRADRQATVNAAGMRDFADVAVEGIVICEGDRIASANRSFAALVGVPQDDLAGDSFSRWLRDPSAVDRLARAADSDRETDLRTAAGGFIPVEILAREISFATGNHRVFSIRDLRERDQAQARIHFLAHHDALTDLPNRRLFADRLLQELARADRSGESLALLCLDLDHFKDINDVFGHAAGDRVLREAADRFRANVRPYDVIGRFGGDEFVILLGSKDQPSSALTVAERLIGAVAQPFDLGGATSSIGLSVGIAFYPSDAQDAETLLAKADVALYRAKQEGRGRVRLFEAAMDQRLRERRSIGEELKGALARGELALCYQPVVSAGGDTTGFEALMQWNRPDGPMAAADFLPIAEECGAVVEIGSWALTEACRTAAGWRNRLRVAVNVSAMQFQQGDLAGLVRRVIAETALEPDRLELEINEAVLIRLPERAGTILKALKGLGVRIAIDDFGTGYSSLANLRAFPIDKIKIDGSFVAGLGASKEAEAIVTAVTTLGRGLGVEVAAGGVATRAQLDALTRRNCGEAQGTLFGPARPIGEFADVTERVKLRRVG
jgi:diguanylate cyclase (GGDEF)-like protein/PAS domain S-box-containing protein